MTPEEVVRAELDAWARLDIEAIMSHLTTDIVWENVPMGPWTGYEEVRSESTHHLGQMESFEAEILNLATSGDVVLTERIDHFGFGGEVVHLRIMGAHEVTGNKIRAWRDYFDMPKGGNPT
jgi:limonene-1,2-epoxide hydrolase